MKYEMQGASNQGELHLSSARANKTTAGEHSHQWSSEHAIRWSRYNNSGKHWGIVSVCGIQCEILIKTYPVAAATRSLRMWSIQRKIMESAKFLLNDATDRIWQFEHRANQRHEHAALLTIHLDTTILIQSKSDGGCGNVCGRSTTVPTAEIIIIIE